MRITSLVNRMIDKKAFSHQEYYFFRKLRRHLISVHNMILLHSNETSKRKHINGWNTPWEKKCILPLYHFIVTTYSPPHFATVFHCHSKSSSSMLSYSQWLLRELSKDSIKCLVVIRDEIILSKIYVRTWEIFLRTPNETMNVIKLHNLYHIYCYLYFYTVKIGEKI